MTTFCATGDALIHIAVPADHPGLSELSEKIATADVRITNLETTVSEYDCYASSFSGGTPLTAHPDRLNDIKAYGFNVVGCANNHALDFSFGGVLSTMKHLQAAGLPFAGIGCSLAEAAAPATVQTPDGKVAVFAQTAVYSGNDSGRAGESHDGIPPRPGVNGLRHIDECVVTNEQMNYLVRLAHDTMVNAEDELDNAFGYGGADDGTFTFGSVKFKVGQATGKTSRCHPKDVARAEQTIRDALGEHRYAVSLIHSHQFPRRVEHEVDYYVEEFAHRAIDAGAHAVVGGGNHLLKGIEIYKGRPIFYCLGNFLFHAEYVTRISADVVDSFGFSQDLTGAEVVAQRKARATNPMEDNEIFYRSVIPFWTMDGDTLTSVKLLPIELGRAAGEGLRGFPRQARPEDILPHLQTICRPYGTTLRISGEYIEVVL